MDEAVTELGYGGAASGGKSYLACAFLTTMCLAYPDTGWLLGRKELTNLKRTTLLTLFKVFRDWGIEADQYNYNQQQNVITFSNESQIFLLDLGYKPSDPLYTRLGGLEITGAVIDESNEIEYKGIEILKTRIGRRKNKEYNLKPKVLETFNPDKGHVYQRYYKPWKDNELPDHRAFIQALPTDNPHTTQDYIEQLRRADKVTRERLLLGNFEYDDNPQALVEYDAIIDMFTNPPDASEHKYMTIDVARFGQDLTVIRVWRGWTNYRTIIRSKQGIDKTQRDVRDIAWQEKVPFSHIIADEDGVGGGLVDNLKGIKGFVANSSPLPNPITRQKENYTNLKAQCTYMMAQRINDRKIRVEEEDVEEQEKLIQEVEQVQSRDIDKDGPLKVIRKEDVKAALGRSPDRWDSLMMRAYFELDKRSAYVSKVYRH